MAEAELTTDEEVVHHWLYHWDTVNGELEGVGEIFAGDFISHSMTEGDGKTMVADIAAFRADHPITYFSIDDLAIAHGKAFLTNWVMRIPEDVVEGVILVI